MLPVYDVVVVKSGGSNKAVLIEPCDHPRHGRHFHGAPAEVEIGMHIGSRLQHCDRQDPASDHYELRVVAIAEKELRLVDLVRLVRTKDDPIAWLRGKHYRVRTR